LLIFEIAVLVHISPSHSILCIQAVALTTVRMFQPTDCADKLYLDT